MKTFLVVGLALSLNSYAIADTNYAPNDGTAKPGNPGVYPNSGMSSPRTNDVTGVDQSTTMDSSNVDPRTESGNAALEKTNTSPNPIPDDTTLQGKTQTGPYKTPGNKQSQESDEEELDYRAIPKVDHSDGEGESTDNQ